MIGHNLHLRKQVLLLCVGQAGGKQKWKQRGQSRVCCFVQERNYGGREQVVAVEIEKVNSVYWGDWDSGCGWGWQPGGMVGGEVWGCRDQDCHLGLCLVVYFCAMPKGRYQVGHWKLEPRVRCEILI